MTIHFKWKTIQPGCCHSLKGDHDHLIEVTTKNRWKLLRLWRKNWDFDNWPLNTGQPLNMVLLNFKVRLYHGFSSSGSCLWPTEKKLTLHCDISSYCLFLFPSIACNANIFSCIVLVTAGDVQLFGVGQMNPRLFPSYLRFRKTRGITTQKQRSWRINCYILWHFRKLDRN